MGIRNFLLTWIHCSTHLKGHSDHLNNKWNCECLNCEISQPQVVINTDHWLYLPVAQTLILFSYKATLTPEPWSSSEWHVVIVSFHVVVIKCTDKNSSKGLFRSGAPDTGIMWRRHGSGSFNQVTLHLLPGNREWWMLVPRIQALGMVLPTFMWLFPKKYGQMPNPSQCAWRLDS